MTSTTEEEIILKSDVLGRVRMPKDKRELILDRFEDSAMSGQAFAAHIGVKYPTFASWIQKRRRNRGDYPRSDGKAPRASVALFEAIVDAPESEASNGVLEVESVGGIKIRLSRSQEIPMAISLLRQINDAKL